MCVKALKRVLRMTYEFRGLIVRHNLETRALAGAVTTIDAEHLAPPALDARVAQSPKLLDLVTLHDLSATMKRALFARSCEPHARSRRAPRCTFRARQTGGRPGSSGNIFGSDDNVGHGADGRRRSDQTDRRSSFPSS
jgi:hypothetical protein